jgi:hypothetical protein
MEQSTLKPEAKSAQPPQLSLEQFNRLMVIIQSLPMLCKQVFYVLLRTSLESSISKSTLERFDADNILQLWTPNVTLTGIAAMNGGGGPMPESMRQMLTAIQQRKSIIVICMTFHWSLEQCALLLAQAIDSDYITPSMSQVTHATIAYLANRIRLGEYLIKIGKITSQQLDQALKTQRYAWEVMGERTAVGNVLINLGYVSQQDTEGILFLKQESRKPL